MTIQMNDDSIQQFCCRTYENLNGCIEGLGWDEAWEVTNRLVQTQSLRSGRKR